MKSFIILKKLYILILFSLFSNLYANKTYITMGVDIDLSVNCNENVIEKIGKVLPKPGIYLGFNSFKEESNIGFHFDGNILVSSKNENLNLAFSTLLGPAFLIGNESGFLISPGISLGFMLGGTNDSTTKNTIGEFFAGIGSIFTYFFNSGFSIGLNFNYYPLTFVHYSITENNKTTKFEDFENSFTVGIMFGYTDWYR